MSEHVEYNTDEIDAIERKAPICEELWIHVLWKGELCHTRRYVPFIRIEEVWRPPIEMVESTDYSE